jgi:hypothetical protein
MSTVKPDILIQYIDNNNPCPVAVIYVRPKTNMVSYEKEILLGIKPYADVVYLANLNGRLFIDNALILEHYSTQYRFAMFGKIEVEKYSEMIKSFEKYFQENFEKANIIGSFEALIQLKKTPEELFNTIVEEKDFLKILGQTIKKIDNFYVINYDIPSILDNYRPETNIFVIVIRLKHKDISFKEIDQAIYKNIQNDKSTPIIDEEKLIKLHWNEKIRRTYHISHNYITAMFDMIDFVFDKDGKMLNPEQIPFLKKLFMNDLLNEEKFKNLKEYNIVYLNDNGEKKLINLAEEANNKTVDECVGLLQKIVW